MSHISSSIYDFLSKFVVLAGVGVLAALILQPVFTLDAVRQIDLGFADLLTRRVAREDIADAHRRGPRFVFIKIGEESCARWAAEKGVSCTASLTIPRDRLAGIVDAIAESIQRDGVRPKLMVLDIDLTPLPSPANSDDAGLCAAIARLSHRVPVSGVQPLSVRQGTSGRRIDRLPSILDAATGGPGACDGEVSADIWLASSLVQEDSDGVVRSVDEWDTLHAADGRQTTVPGVGLLGAALIEGDANRVTLACIYGRPGAVRCPSPKLHVAGREYNPAIASSTPDRILYLIPYGTYGQRGIEDFGYTPTVIDSVEADDLAIRLADDRSLLNDAVVMVGSSYAASRDLYFTPLNPQFPGAMIHVNAINAYATNRLITQPKSWTLELLLIACSAFAGALFHALGKGLAERLQWPWNDLIEMLFALGGVATAFVLVFFAAYFYASRNLAQESILIGAITPAYFVALEGIYTTIHDFERFIHAATQRTRRI